MQFGRTHPDISMITSQSLHDELTKIEVALKKILGIKPKFFRPPYGSYNQAALEVLESRGYSSKSHVYQSANRNDTAEFDFSCIVSSNNVVYGLRRFSETASRCVDIEI